MLGLLLGWMAYDTVQTVSKREQQRNQEKANKQRIWTLEHRLRKGMTQGHYYKCVCLLCVNRRKQATEELARLKNTK